MKKIISLLSFVIATILIFPINNTLFASPYTIGEGDSLTSISEQKLGDSSKWADIYNANLDKITDPNVIEAGIVINIPDKKPIKNDNEEKIKITNAPIGQAVEEKEVPIQTYYKPAPVRTNTNYDGLIQDAANQYGIDAGVMKRIIMCESGGNPNAYNPSGATGIAQFMPGTYNGSWNTYKDKYPINSAEGGIYSMALKMHLEGGTGSWTCK